MAALELRRPRRGRPRKFGRPSHAITLTLPDDVIAALKSVDGDVSRAVVRVSQPAVSKSRSQPPAELAAYGGSAVIVIKPAATLERMAGVALVPLADGRALISLDEAMSVHEFELRLRDAEEDAGAATPAPELATVAAIIDILKRARRTRGLRIERRAIIVLRSPGRRRIADLLERSEGTGRAKGTE